MTTSFFSGTNVAPEADSTNELIDTLTSQVATVTAANSQAQAAAVEAAASASNAKISEANVSTLAQQANTTLAQANTAISTANDAVTQANTAATTATNQANIATQQAGQSTTSATNAATSETHAKTSETNAASSASAAAGSATAASGSASAASTSATNAATSATNAKTSETNAKTSETNASTSAGNASNSASAAATSASNASTSATNAANSATDAAGSATAASGSATAAATSATNAANSAALITLPLPISSGGTGKTTALAALGALGIPAVPPLGQCRLSAASATSLLLSPFQGNLINVNGVLYQIPSAGISLSSSGLAASTLYYIYVYSNAGVLTLEASTTTHVTNTSNGIEQKSGDASRTLVGMVFTNGSSQFVDSALSRTVLNWFNRQAKGLQSPQGNNSTSSASPVVLGNPLTFLTWSGDSVMAAVAGYMSLGSTTGQYANAQVCIDSSGIPGALAINNFTTTFTNYNAGCTGVATGLTEGKHTAGCLGSASGGANVTLTFAVFAWIFG